MKYNFLFLFAFLLSTGCQDYGNLQLVTSLPKSLKEVSGMEVVVGSDLIWMINDSGNAPKIYGYDIAEKNIAKTISISNVSNIDWEDLASNQNGDLYIGDFGNNGNKRKDLAIYTVKNCAAIKGDEVSAIITTFYFKDQNQFPPRKKNRNFDVEAFVSFNGFFYLFTRNRSSDFDGTTKLYKIPIKEGRFEAQLIDSFKTCDDERNCQITGATLDHASGNIALLSANKVWLLRGYSNDDVFGEKIEIIELHHSSHKESITFKNSNTLYIADEQKRFSGGNIFELKIFN
jgi:hypothetical protein